MPNPQKIFLGLLAMSNSPELAAGKQTDSCPGFPPNTIEFSSLFHQPTPPLVSNEFKASWIQHKWNVNISHITGGFLYNSPTAGKVRVDQSYDMNIGSSIFDYTNISSNGLVSNIMYLFTPSIASPPSIFSDYVNSNFPLFTQDMLQTNGAVFTGLTHRDKNGKVASWSFLYQNAIPVTVFLNECNTVVGYDYFAPEFRTRVVTEFFNVEVGLVPGEVFKLPP
ncbi:uncharacterized protein PAC_00124 [Phialocephala subalpina]|uniref:Uncharacterized protein n=1 Tax=Phialocephala subalpina TaxID=576137 RepID=A0A1L7WBT8_9HELO|nr:uncharacterized protein PAC_00124 [Phialocephala subalpina]